MENETKATQDGESVWGPRVPISIDSTVGFMTSGDAVRPIDVHGDISIALSSYLSMVYELRNMSTGVIPLREEDLLVLADAFEMDETDVATRLARLMHCDDLQTHRLIQMLKKGRVLVPISMVTAGAVLAGSLVFTKPPQPDLTATPTQSHATVDETDSSAPPVATQVSVDIGEATQVERAIVTDEVAKVDNVDNGTDSAVASGNLEAAVDPTSVVPSNTPPPDLGPGEVAIGDAISVSRDDPAQ
ncbi:MAG TPA: hypothetical protein PKB15_01840 [Acidimicrobiia bacterium]|nr:hypothetical protein [Acidimicrobiia bacterium]